MKEMPELVGEIQVLSDLAPAHLELVAGCAHNAHFEAGTYLFREGEAANSFYAIRHGSTALEIHVPAREAVIIETLHEGDLLGWSWLFPP